MPTSVGNTEIPEDKLSKIPFGPPSSLDVTKYQSKLDKTLPSLLVNLNNNDYILYHNF